MDDLHVALERIAMVCVGGIGIGRDLVDRSREFQGEDEAEGRYFIPNHQTLAQKYLRRRTICFINGLITKIFVVDRSNGYLIPS